MRRLLIGITVLLLPTLAALSVFLFVNKKIPTRREAIGQVGSVAGDGSIFPVDGKVDVAGFSDPFGIAIDRKGNVVVADAGDANKIRRISPSGIVETIAGSNEGFADGNSKTAQFNTPSGLAVDRRDNILIADTSNNRIRKLDPDGNVSTIAGSGNPGSQNGASGDAQFDGPLAVAVDPNGNIIVADTYNDRIRRIASDGQVTTLSGSERGFADGSTDSARFDTPSGVAADAAGNVFVADTGNSAIRKIDPAGQVTTIANRSSESNGRRSLTRPIGVTVTHDGFLYVTCDDGVFRITAEGQLESYSGGKTGYANGNGQQARFNNPAGIAVDREGNVYVADTQNHSIRMIVPIDRGTASDASQPDQFVQPPVDRPVTDNKDLRPRLETSQIARAATFPWPVAPQDKWHEVAGVVGEARGAPNGIALDHLHSGLDVRAPMGDAVLSIYDEKVSSPHPNWDFDGTNEGITVGIISYIHIRVGRDANDSLITSAKFKALTDESKKVIGVRVRRGTRFKVGDFIGTINKMYHVHLNLGPWNAQANPISFPFPGFTDSVLPVIEPNGIEVIGNDGKPITEKKAGRIVVKGDVEIWVTAFDKVDGNVASRKLGLYKLGYQIVSADGTPVKGYEQPLVNIEFNRLPPDDPTVALVYAPGSGVIAYGTPTRFTYIVTNLVRDGIAMRGVLRTAAINPGDYLIRIDASDYAGNRATGSQTELPITILR